MKVAVLAGGRSSEHDVSLVSALAVAAGVREAGHEAVEVRLGRDGSWTDGESGAPVLLAPGGGLLGADVVWPALHGPFGEDGTIQGLLEVLDVAYVGAGVLASALCMDKVAFKQVLEADGVPQVDSVAVRESRWRNDPAGVRADLGRLGLPVFVKPARLGSSVGIAKAAGEAALDAALDGAFAHDDLVIVEAFASGIEIECAVIGNERPQASVPGEVVLQGAEWYDYEAKYAPGGVELVVPARLPDDVIEAVRALACDTFLRVGCVGMARVDFFVEHGEVLVNELNTLPGITPTSAFPVLWEATGLPFAAVCERLLGLAVERHAAQAAHRH